jgi:hypothetical protein
MEHTGTNKVKLIANQARIVNLYKNLRSKLLKCCANIYFNRQCLHIDVLDENIYILFKHCNLRLYSFIILRICRCTSS